jgi:hypothetical protein
MEEYMLETNVDPEIILGKVQRQMTNLSISPQGPSTSRSFENRAIGGGILQGVPPNVRNDPGASQETRQKIEMAQMSRTIRQMQNEITRLKRGENLIPPNPNMRAPLHDQRIRNDRIEEHRPRAPRVPNPNVVVLEEIVEEENFENLIKKQMLTKMKFWNQYKWMKVIIFLYF